MRKITYLLFFITAISCNNDDSINQLNSENEIIHEKLNIRELESKMKNTGYTLEDFRSFNSEITKSETYKMFSNSSNSNEYYVDYFEDPVHGIITYSFTTQELDKNGYLENCVTTIENGEITMGYLRFYPENGIFTERFTGKIEVMNMSRTEISTSHFKNFEYIPENKTSAISTECNRTFKIVATTCSHGGFHVFGQACDPGFVNDADLYVNVYTSCKKIVTSDIYKMPNTIISLNPSRGEVEVEVIVTLQMLSGTNFTVT